MPVLFTYLAAKAAVLKFIQSKDTHQREKDLLKSVRVCCYKSHNIPVAMCMPKSCAPFPLAPCRIRTCLGTSQARSRWRSPIRSGIVRQIIALFFLNLFPRCQCKTSRYDIDCTRRQTRLLLIDPPANSSISIPNCITLYHYCIDQYKLHTMLHANISCVSYESATDLQVFETSNRRPNSDLCTPVPGQSL